MAEPRGLQGRRPCALVLRQGLRQVLQPSAYLLAAVGRPLALHRQAATAVTLSLSGSSARQ